LVSTPKLDTLVEVAKQAAWNLKKRESGIKIEEPSAKPEKGKPPPPKRHQHPLPTKGKSAYVGKGKATAPGKKPLEVITISARDVLESLLQAQEPRMTSPSRPTATSALKPIATIAETVTTKEMQIEETQNKDNEARELPPTTDVRPDLELSQDTEEEELHGVCIVDLDAEKPFIEFSDVEPDYTAEELAARAQQSTASATATSTMLPEILFDFQETVVISDDETVTTTTSSMLSTMLTSSTAAATSTSSTAETSTVLASTPKFILVTEPCRSTATSPATVSTPKVKSTVVVVSTVTTSVATVTTSVPTVPTATTSESSTSKMAVAPSKPPISGQRPISSTASDNLPTRKPCQQEKPYNAARQVKTQVPEPEPIPRPPETTPPAQRHLKLIDHKKLANVTLDYNISTDEISRGFALKYALKEGERYALRKDLCKMRLAQKAILLKIRAKFPVNCASEERCQDYLDYFEHESLKAVSRQSDSDDDFNIGKTI